MFLFSLIFQSITKLLLSILLLVQIASEALKFHQVPGLLRSLQDEISLPPESLQNLERDLVATIRNTSYDVNRPFLAERTSAKFTPDTEKIGDESNINLAAYFLMTTRYKIPRETALLILQRTLSPFCTEPKAKFCDKFARFRSIDGSCNNLVETGWGASFTPFDRLLPHAYEDGFNEPRGGISSDDQYLPNPRKITTTIHYDVISPDKSITNMVPQFGQFLDHDMTLTPEADKHCCTSEESYVDCHIIEIPQNDIFYSNLEPPRTCMDFTRSTPYCFPGKNGVREQFNILTAFVDASQVYGSEHKRAKQLRAFMGGRLLTKSEDPNMLPTVTEVGEKYGIHIAFMGKYLAGDERVNEMPALTTMHILLVREHNRLADQIQQNMPSWSDDQVFDEARRILIAEWQNIVYGEYLPVILGPDTMHRFDLNLDGSDIYSTYEPDMNPTIFQSFATAAFRFGHTLVNGLVLLYRGLQLIGGYRVKDNFFESEQVERDGGDGYNLILGGLIVQNAQSYDPHVTTALTEFLFQDRTRGFGGDLIARNVHRAREHGVQFYSAYRQFCGLSPLTTWAKKPPEIPRDIWRLLNSLYRIPQEIDLFTGGLSEIPVRGGFSGTTFNCLKAMQFHRVKFGDRFFFTHRNQAGSFTREQIRHLRKRTLGDILCENSNLAMTSVNVFRIPSPRNPQLFCNAPERTKLNITLLIGRPD